MERYLNNCLTDKHYFVCVYLGCGIILSYPDNITMSGTEQSGEWLTENVEITHDLQTNNRTYLSVCHKPYVTCSRFSYMYTLQNFRNDSHIFKNES